MQLILIGFGKLGKTVVELAKTQNIPIKAIFTRANFIDFRDFQIEDSDVALEITSPAVAAENLSMCAEKGLTTVCGTTGWLDSLSEIEQAFEQNKTGFLYASNFSLAMNVFFEAVHLVSLKLKDSPFDISISEAHHKSKLDIPSGTAITLQQIVKMNAHNPDINIPVESIREGDIKGKHVVHLQGAFDSISLTHEASSRIAFAEGALRACQWMENKKGIFSMKDVLGL